MRGSSHICGAAGILVAATACEVGMMAAEAGVTRAAQESRCARRMLTHAVCDGSITGALAVAVAT